MRILVLGGTVFLGRHFVYAAVERGHTLTLFNRGISNPDLFPDVETLVGHRDGNLQSLTGRQWDVVLDTSGYVPRIVRASAQMLAGSAEQYIFISSISVYDTEDQTVIDEDSPVAELQDETVEEINGMTYGALKALCERVVTNSFSGCVLNIRPGLIAGPEDPSDRFTYWPWRIFQGGTVLSPGYPHAPVQFIDVRDLAMWLVKTAESKVEGTVNVTGPKTSLSMGELLELCIDELNPGAELEWVTDSFLVEEAVGPWVEMPLWIPGKEADSLMQISISRALELGLEFRPLRETIIDTRDWAMARPQDYSWRAGLTLDRERELLAKWRNTAR